MLTLQKIKNHLEARSNIILWSMIIIYIAVIFLLCLFKYNSFGYNALDLGIYNQVFYNTSLGDLWQFTIHPHNYLGDHFELIILLLSPFYFIFKSPITLIFLQTLFIGLAAWPIYLITKNILSKSWALFFSCAFLLNPFVINANFFEFHALSFCIFFLLFVFYFYQKNKFWPYLFFCLFSLLIREDIALIIIGFGLLAIVEKRNLKWILAPILAGGIWFAVAFNLIGYFNQYGSYKFLSLYSWLGSSAGEMIKNFFLKPSLVISHILSLNNLFFTLGLLLPFLALPIFKLKYLLPAFFIIVQLFLLNSSGLIVMQTHYNLPLIPFLYIASIYAITWLLKSNKVNSLKSFITRQKAVFFSILIVAVCYSFITFSPVLPTLKNVIKNSPAQSEKNIRNQAVSMVDGSDITISSYNFLPQLSTRKNVYSLHYAFLGKKQFSDEDFLLPETIDKMVINFEDFIIYNIQSNNVLKFEEQYYSGDQRINDIINEKNLGLSYLSDSIAVYEKNYDSKITLYEIMATVNEKINAIEKKLGRKIKFIGWKQNQSINNNISESVLPISLYWQTLQTMEEDYQLRLELTDKNNKVIYKKYYPVAYGLYPTRRWKQNEIIKTNYEFLLPDNYDSSQHTIQISLVELKGYLELDRIGSAIISITDEEVLGEPIKLSI